MSGGLEGRNIENLAEDGKEHIEMDLGLGVLEEKGYDAESGSSTDDSSSDEGLSKRKSKLGAVMNLIRGRKGKGKGRVKVEEVSGG